MTREELWLAAIAGLDGANPPDYPVWHYEEMLAAIYDVVTGVDSPRPFPARSWHLDEVLYAVYCVAAGLDDPGCPEPTDRIELFWKGIYDAASGSGSTGVPAPVWRLEEFLSAVFTALGERTLTGSIVSFIGRANTEILALATAIAPVQDLHGYDHPWPGGGGKNKLKFPYASGSSVSANNVTYTVNSDGSITIATNGTASAQTDFHLWGGASTYEDVKLPSGTYTFSIKSSANITAGTLQTFIREDGVTNPLIGQNVTGTSWNASATIADTAGHRWFLRVASGKSVNTTIKLQVEAGSTATAWEPYSNECPITGWTGANVYVSPTQDVADATVYNVDWTSAAGTVYGGTLDALTGKLTVTHVGIDMGSVDYTMNTTHKFAAFFPTGTNAMVEFNDKIEVAPIMCSSYKVGAYNNVWATITDGICVYQTGAGDEKFGVIDHNYSDKDSFKTAVTGQKIVYPLKTQKTYNLTAQQVAALVGQNYVWADTGDVTVKVKAAA